MVDNAKEVRKQVLDVIGMLAAVVTIIAYVVLCINAQWTFIDDGSFVLNVLKVIQTYAPLVVVGIVGLEAISKRSLLFQIIFIGLMAIVVIFLFFPDTYANLIGTITAQK